MAFTFQINDDVTFQHNEAFLNKAWACEVPVDTMTHTPSGLAKLVKDPEKFSGYTTKICDDMTVLNTKGWKRDDTFILDFGQHCVGHFSLNIHSIGSPMDAPLYFRIRFAEMPAELAMESSQYDGWLSKSWIQEEFIHVDVLPVQIKLPRRYSFRYVEIKVIDTSPKWQAVFTNPSVEVEGAVLYTQPKSVTLSDPILQQIYDTSVKTLADCMQDVFEDGPKRDRRLWLGDLRLQALANYASFDHQELVKRCLYLFGAMPCTDGRIVANVFVQPENKPDDTFLFDYGLFFISTLYDYYHHYEDKDTLNDLYPIAKAQMEVALRYVNDQGALCLKEDYPVFVDWSNEFDKDTAGQAIMIYAWKQFLQLSEIMQDQDLATYQRVLQCMSAYASNALYDKERNLFVSGPEKEYNIASQVWMVLAQIFPQKQNQLIMETTLKELFPVKGIATPYMYHHVSEALFMAGLKKDAIQLMKDYWGKMIELGADTFWEAFDPDRPDYSPYDSPLMSSYCHAWSCTPAYLIQTYCQE